MRHTTYLSGPMSGLPSFNFPAFSEAAQYLRAGKGWTVLSPAERDIDSGFNPDTDTLADIDLNAAMADDFKMVIEADSITLLPGWENSRGAKAERFVAEMCGKEAFLYIPALQDRILKAAPITHTTETRVTDPATGGQKGSKLARFDLLPARAMWQVAELYGRGAEKYADRNWELGYAWHLSFAAMMRHAWLFWGGEDVDAETQCPHLASVVFHALALMTFAETETGTDDRPR